MTPEVLGGMTPEEAAIIAQRPDAWEQVMGAQAAAASAASAAGAAGAAGAPAASSVVGPAAARSSVEGAYDGSDASAAGCQP